MIRPLVKIRVHAKNNIFLFFMQKHMLWMLNRTVAMRRFFKATKTYVKAD